MSNRKRLAFFLLISSFSCSRHSHAANFLLSNHVTNLPPPTHDIPSAQNQALSQQTNGAVTLVNPRPPATAPPFVSGVILVSMGNMALNWFRPDPNISWENRIPRIMWESLILFTASSIKAMPNSPLSYLLLSLMLGCTALIDIFFWAPIFGFATSFDNHDCSGGWFTGRPYVCTRNPKMDVIKGYGRLLVIFQCLYTGVFYLKSSIESWAEFIDARDIVKAERQARMFQQYVQHSTPRYSMILARTTT